MTEAPVTSTFTPYSNTPPHRTVPSPHLPKAPCRTGSPSKSTSSRAPPTESWAASPTKPFPRETSSSKTIPAPKNLIDGRELYCYAIADGTFTYRNVLGAKTTVPCYNYGHPYNPLGSDPLAGITNLTVIQATTNAPPATAATNRPVRLAPPPQTIFIK
jgi:hypothetical protein